MLRNCRLKLVVPVLLAVIAWNYRAETMSVYRAGVWFIKGMREYTKYGQFFHHIPSNFLRNFVFGRSGYESAAKKFNKDDLNVDCKGKSYMITGTGKNSC
jgi:hypothetical protein